MSFAAVVRVHKGSQCNSKQLLICILQVYLIRIVLHIRKLIKSALILSALVCKLCKLDNFVCVYFTATFPMNVQEDGEY